MLEELEEDEIAGKQQNIKERRIEQLRPWQYKKGQSGNPSGRPKGISLKEYAKIKFASMTDDEKEEFMNGLSKDTIWEMAEGKPQQSIDGNLDVKVGKLEEIQTGLKEILNGHNKKDSEPAL